MKLNGRRESNNVEDRRGKRSVAAGAGIGGIIIAAIMAWITTGGDLSQVFNVVAEQASQTQTTEQADYQPTPEEQKFEKFSRQILAGTEDVWTQLFREKGWQYEAPTLVFFTDAVQSACGNATSQVGPFYCSGDQKLYIDLSFFEQMDKQMKAGGDLAHAYVIAHEVGHHIEYSTGLLNKAHQQMSRLSEKEANQISVRIELLADYYAGVWAHHDQKNYGSIDNQDILEAINCAQKIGDDYLQKQARGYAVPESFNHGTSEQRARWFKKGLESGKFEEQPTFGVPYEQL
ncbi:MAG: neutral zinc metallopeptidase [Alloprevotella sp.]|nr:neutral zinc metallopeptidase [Alloprevotella sp.]MBR1595038.1 neutral zinc metallopeptidase [Alloprevotella sp.]